ncbi:TSUP family transporter, partial [Desulfobacterales bacterium HSG17]|nr:TSUP family transporter [Desulfobacterales bacterium HSG17]
IDLTIQIYILLFITGLCSGFVDSIAGGGGLIALPVLFSVGLPPDIALGTNKLQGSFGTLSASYNYIKKGVVKFNESLSGILYTLIGAVLGAMTIQHMEAGFIKELIPVLLLFVFIYTLLSKDLGHVSTNPRIPQRLFFLLFGLGLGFYDGFFGPGTGSFWTAALLSLLGLNMKKASGITRIMNFTSNIVALTVFIIGGKVLYSAGFCMAAGQIMGARVGSNLAIKKGVGFIRPIFLIVVFLTIVRLAYLTYFV